MKRLTVLVTLALLSISMASAQNAELDRGPGLVGPDSSVYGLEVAMDNVAMDIGLAKPGMIAQERASEARRAFENNRTDAAVRAGRQIEKASERTGEDQSEELDRAMISFRETINRFDERIENAPNEQARQGMRTALDNMRTAFDNIEEARNRKRTGKAPDGNATDEETEDPENSSQVTDRPDVDQTVNSTRRSGANRTGNSTNRP